MRDVHISESWSEEETLMLRVLRAAYGGVVALEILEDYAHASGLVAFTGQAPGRLGRLWLRARLVTLRGGGVRCVRAPLSDLGAHLLEPMEIALERVEADRSRLEPWVFEFSAHREAVEDLVVVLEKVIAEYPHQSSQAEIVLRELRSALAPAPVAPNVEPAKDDGKAKSSRPLSVVRS